MTPSEIDFVLERFDQTDREIQRGVVVELLRQLKQARDVADALAERVAAQSELLSKVAESMR